MHRTALRVNNMPVWFLCGCSKTWLHAHLTLYLNGHLEPTFGTLQYFYKCHRYDKRKNIFNSYNKIFIAMAGFYRIASILVGHQQNNNYPSFAIIELTKLLWLAGCLVIRRCCWSHSHSKNRFVISMLSEMHHFQFTLEWQTFWLKWQTFVLV